MNLLRFLFSQFVMHADEPSLASGAPAAPAFDPAVARTFLADFVEPAAIEGKPDDDVKALYTRYQTAVTKHAPKPQGEQFKPEDVTAATEFLSKNVDGATPESLKGKTPEEIMGLRRAFDTVQANDARKFLKGSGVKAEDVAKMSNLDAIKAAEEARAKPVNYAEFKLPEGLKKDEVLDKTFREWAGKNKLSQEAAQEIVSAYSTRLAEVMQQPYTAWKKIQDDWRAEVAKDPEVGGEKLQQNLGQIGKMIDAVAGDRAKSVREAMDSTGFGNNPAAIKFFFAISKYFVEGGPLSGKGAVTHEKGGGNPAKTLYPDQPSEAAG